MQIDDRKTCQISIVMLRVADVFNICNKCLDNTLLVIYVNIAEITFSVSVEFPNVLRYIVIIVHSITRYRRYCPMRCLLSFVVCFVYEEIPQPSIVKMIYL